MSTHLNPITNVTAKIKVSKKTISFINVSLVSPLKLDTRDPLSFMEMNMNQIKKYFKNDKNNS